ncbi:hypothetical protein TanjilG_00070 [Lupinus angustifolius]|uniref:Uncharacterized protein n=1 Tax=Lupinus angustifolius TaxID=3871 RepID=A0A394CYU3_LUPAN|nr:hypothetical protein TanjilG_00070 [Lupinus angustifolius]
MVFSGQINAGCGLSCIGKRLNEEEEYQGEEDINVNYCEACFLNHGLEPRSNQCGGMHKEPLDTYSINLGPCFSKPINLLHSEFRPDANLVGPKSKLNMHEPPISLVIREAPCAPVLIAPNGPGLLAATEASGAGVAGDQIGKDVPLGNAPLLHSDF